MRESKVVSRKSSRKLWKSSKVQRCRGPREASSGRGGGAGRPRGARSSCPACMPDARCGCGAAALYAAGLAAVAVQRSLELLRSSLANSDRDFISRSALPRRHSPYHSPSFWQDSSVVAVRPKTAAATERCKVLYSTRLLVEHRKQRFVAARRQRTRLRSAAAGAAQDA